MSAQKLIWDERLTLIMIYTVTIIQFLHNKLHIMDFTLHGNIKLKSNSARNKRNLRGQFYMLTPTKHEHALTDTNKVNTNDKAVTKQNVLRTSRNRNFKTIK